MPRPPPHPLLVTDRIAQLNELLVGRYVVQREIGAGGMATVYLAEDVKHHRKVAIKVLRDDISASVGGARFLREIEIAAQLQHPEIHFAFANQGEAAETIRNYLSRQEFNLENVLLDSGRQLGAILGSGALPTTLFFDAQGVLVEQRMGELSAATLAQRLESLRQGR